MEYMFCISRDIFGSASDPIPTYLVLLLVVGATASKNPMAPSFKSDRDTIQQQLLATRMLVCIMK